MNSVLSCNRGNSLTNFEDALKNSNDNRIPFFTADITLSIPNVVRTQTIVLIH